MEKERIIALYTRYRLGQASPDDLEELQQLMADPQKGDRLHESWKLEWEGMADQEFLNLRLDNDDQIFDSIVAQPQARMRRLWPRIAIAAAVATVVFGAGLFLYKGSLRQATEVQASINDVAPGKQGATLTLASGIKIQLSDAANGELGKESGVVISKSANGQLVYEIKPSERVSSDLGAINTLSTANGETYQVRLPDGSMVWLNAASSITYSANLLQHGKRRVRLDGEAFFEIAKDRSKPFVVESKGQQVEVLGTHFNVNAYANEESTNTVLVEGSVQVTAGRNQKVLKPGEQALRSGNAIQVSAANIDNIMDWKSGDFYLDRIDFKQAMRKIARWYNVEVVYDADVPETLESGGWISRSNNLSAVLRSIEKSGLVHFRIEGRKVYISK